MQQTSNISLITICTNTLVKVHTTRLIHCPTGKHERPHLAFRIVFENHRINMIATEKDHFYISIWSRMLRRKSYQEWRDHK